MLPVGIDVVALCNLRQGAQPRIHAVQEGDRGLWKQKWMLDRVAGALLSLEEANSMRSILALSHGEA